MLSNVKFMFGCVNSFCKQSFMQLKTHRWPLKRFSHGPLSNIMLGHGVMALSKHMKKKAKARELEREEAGGGDIFFMRTAEETQCPGQIKRKRRT